MKERHNFPTKSKSSHLQKSEGKMFKKGPGGGGNLVFGFDTEKKAGNFIRHEKEKLVFPINT